MSTVRAACALVLLLMTARIAAAIRMPTVAGAPTIQVPLAFDSWRGADLAPPDDATIDAVGADHIVDRSYVGPNGQAVGLYIASYFRQRPGTSIHSPLHCLPGTGWNVLTDDVLKMGTERSTADAIRRLVAVRGQNRILVLYWYAIRDRMIASDLLSRVYLLDGSLRLGRNDASLVRIVVPVDGTTDAVAEEQGLAFAHALLPQLAERRW
jgi:EpsI family protein